MEPHAALIERLKRHPELDYKEIPGGVRIGPPGPGGFVVEVRGGDGEWTVFLGEAGFHETFDSEDETLNLVACCYSGEARLREVWRGGSPAKAFLEAREEGTWRCVSETGLIFVPFWRKRREVVLENPNLLKA
jgi:hypothetical protein